MDEPDVITVETIQTAMDRMLSQPYRPCEHLAPPSPPTGYVWRMDTAEGAIRVVPCANLCGASIFLIPIRTRHAATA